MRRAARPRSTCAGPRRRWSRFPTRRPARSRSCSPSATSDTAEFELDGDEFDFYDALTRYVEDQSIKAAAATTPPAAGPLGFTMAMLQRRMASSVYAVRRSLERMRDKREKILADPEAYRQEQIEQRAARRLRRPARGRAAGDHRPSWRTWSLSVDPAALREEILRARQADRPGAGARRARGRVQAQQAPRGADRAGHLRRPEDEAAHLHRAQGHARLPRRRRQGRPAARQAPRVGPHRHADPRRHEDRRPRHAGHAASTPSASSARTARCWSPPRPPARASTCSSAG